MNFFNKFCSMILSLVLVSPLSNPVKKIDFSTQTLAPVTHLPQSIQSLTPKGAPKKYIYAFWKGAAEGSKENLKKIGKDQNELLGGKGEGLAEMTCMGLSVPPGFTITTEATKAYFDAGHKIPPGLREELDAYVDGLGIVRGKKFGDPKNPLLVSVRSGARISMPGMMDTILNVGLNDVIVKEFAEEPGKSRLAWDSYRRLMKMFGVSVCEIDDEEFEAVVHKIKSEKNIQNDADLTVEDFERIIDEYKQIYKANNKDFPQDVKDQLISAILAVYHSSYGKRALDYKKIEGIPEDVVSAVNVQTMVFGNANVRSGTAVLFTRDYNTGENQLTGEWLSVAQGEDVVAGIRTPENVSVLKERMPGVWQQLLEIKRNLERNYKDMQDTEFTVEDELVYMLQTRNGTKKSTAAAALKIAHDLVQERIIDKETAVSRITSKDVLKVLSPSFNQKDKKAALENGRLLTKGIGAVPGDASGKIYFSAERVHEEIEKAKEDGRPRPSIILVRKMTSAGDIKGMHDSAGILTAVGGASSHAAVVARGWGKPCVVGAGEIKFNDDHHPTAIKIGEITLEEGSEVSLSGLTGEVIKGALNTEKSIISLGFETDEVIDQMDLSPELKEEEKAAAQKARESEPFKMFKTLLDWANDIRREGAGKGSNRRVLQVRSNSDQPWEALLSREYGAEGIGLVRTEHMFFDKDRIPYFRKMIMADTVEERKEVLADLKKFQRKDFFEILTAMDTHESIIRLLDPPLHEFLPHEEEEIAAFAKKFGIDPLKVKERVKDLDEQNPMMGHRGVRLMISYPEVAQMQMEAIIEAAIELIKAGKDPRADIEIPLVSLEGEVIQLRKMFDEIKERLFKENGLENSEHKKHVRFGVMFETARACLIARKLAGYIDFGSFGTNDLTQFTFGWSRDDAEKAFIPDYEKLGIIQKSPFVQIDADGVGELIKMTVKALREEGNRLGKYIDIGVCGEQGGDSESIHHFFEFGLDNVSPSTNRVPNAIFSAAHATLKAKRAIEEKQKAVENAAVDRVKKLAEDVMSGKITPDDPRYQNLQLFLEREEAAIATAI